ncbi:hypothetical protein V8C42DRAFT_320731 [Trichoderma barbatum]
MANSSPEPQIVLYDLACTKGVCFSPVVWRIRLLLNYKRIPYKTIFLEMPDIEPTLKGLGLPPHDDDSGNIRKYTVPAIYYVPDNRYIMDSKPIARFLEATYPDPSVPLASELGNELELKIRSLVAPTFYKSTMPREITILSPRAQEYFRRTREARFGRALEDFFEGEEERWQAVDADRRAMGELMQTNKALGPFILGAEPSYTDFFIAGSLQCMRVIDEGLFQRVVECPGYKDIYEACQPYMERND